MSKISWGQFIDDWDETMKPFDVRPVLFVKGTPYEMGRQYGEAMAVQIKRNFCACAGISLREDPEERIERILKSNGGDIHFPNEIGPDGASTLDKSNREVVEKTVVEKVEAMRRYTPEIIEYWQGMADGAGVTLYDIGLINFFMWFKGSFHNDCSIMAAKDSATEDGTVVAGVNDDVNWDNVGYGPFVVNFPDEGNTFITSPGIAGQMSCNFAMNDKGLTIMFAGGECNGEGDLDGEYWDFITLLVNMVWKCSNAEEAIEMFRKVPVRGGWNFLFSDASRNISILETTSAHSKLRKPGDHGEKDFILGTNHFVDAQMRTSSFPGNEDSYNRYNTEEKLLHESYGEITLDTLKNILGCPDYWDGEKWHKNSWGFSDLATATEHSEFTPEMRSPDFKPGFRILAEPERRRAHILMGGRDLGNAYNPHPMGQYITLNVIPDIIGVTSRAETDAMMEIWRAAEHMSKNDYTHTCGYPEEMAQAKLAFWRGRNCLAKAENLTDPNQIRKYYAKATTYYCEAMVLGRKIREADPML